MTSDPQVLRELDGNAAVLARLILDQSADPRERWSAAGRFDWIMRQHTGIAKAPFVRPVVALRLELPNLVQIASEFNSSLHSSENLLHDGLSTDSSVLERLAQGLAAHIVAFASRYYV